MNRDTQEKGEMDSPSTLVSSRKNVEGRRREGEMCGSDIIGSESDRWRRVERMDILNADTALSERPHRHDIKTLK